MRFQRSRLAVSLVAVAIVVAPLAVRVAGQLTLPPAAGTTVVPTPGVYDVLYPNAKGCTATEGRYSCTDAGLSGVWWGKALVPGTYDVYADWVGSLFRGPAATYTVYGPRYAVLATFSADHGVTSAPDLTIDARCLGYSWCGTKLPLQRLGSFVATEKGTHWVKVTAGKGGIARGHYLMLRRADGPSATSSVPSVASSAPQVSSASSRSSAASQQSASFIPSSSSVSSSASSVPVPSSASSASSASSTVAFVALPGDIVLDDSMMRPDYRCASAKDAASAGGSYSNCATGTAVSWSANVAPGRYEVYATWKASADASPRAAVDFRSMATFSPVDYLDFTRPLSLTDTPSGASIGGVPFRKVGAVDLLASATMVTWADPDRIRAGAAGKPIVIDAIVLRRIGDTPYANAPVDAVALDDEYSIHAMAYQSSFRQGGYRGGYAELHPERAPGVGSSSYVQFVVPPLRAGMYDVLATWPSTEGATRAALVTVRAKDGGNVFLVDQTLPSTGETVDDANWRVVGKAYLPSDGTATIQVTPHVLRSAYVPGVVLVDGFLLRRSADQEPPTTFVLDDADPSFVTAAADYFVAPRANDPSSYRGTHVVLRNDAPATVPDPVARVTINDGGRALTPGSYDVYATWRPQQSVTAVRLQVFADTTPMSDADMAAVTIDQRDAPSGIEWDGVTWQKIAIRTVRPGSKTLYGNWYTGRQLDPLHESPRLIDADAIMLRPSDGIDPSSSSSSSYSSSSVSSVSSASSEPQASSSSKPPAASSAPGGGSMSMQLNYAKVRCSGAVRTLQLSYVVGGGCANLYDAAGKLLDRSAYCGPAGLVTRYEWSFATFPVPGTSVKLCDHSNPSSCSSPVVVSGTSTRCIAI